MASRKSGKAAGSPPFVFRGTVKKLRAATMKDVKPGDRTAVVHVDEVLESPPSFANYAGHDITVELAGRAKAAAGDVFVFHAESWMFGESVAVRAVTQERETKSRAAAAVRAVGDPVENHKSRKLDEHLDDADLVVSGQVTAVTVPPVPVPATRAAGAAPEPSGPVSEHDPKWRQAVIQVDETHKGSHESREVTVLFPASTDVRWFRAPKFQAGQKGTFVLHKTKLQSEEHPALRGLAAAAGTTEMDVYTALHPADVQPVTAKPAIKAKLR